MMLVSVLNAQVTDNACVGGLYRINDPSTLGFPPGLSTDNKGTWSSVPNDLTFTPSTIFQTIVTGFKANTLYTVNWKSAKNGKDYVFYINVGNTVASVGQLQVQNPGWNTQDVVYCSGSGTNYDFRITGSNLTAYEFWKTGSTGSSTVWRSSSGTSTATLNNGVYSSQDVIWGITTDNNGCKSITDNSIRMSAMTSTEVRVVGGISSCDNTIPSGLTLEVMPYNSSYSYQWYRDGLPIVGATSSTYTVNSFGSYYVQVSGCATTFNTNSVAVTSQVLPDVSITGDNICAEGQSSTLTSTLSFADAVTYEWYYGGARDVTLGTSLSANVSSVGDYKVMIRSAANSFCYKYSNTLPIDLKNIQATFTKSNNATPFCSNATPSSRTPIFSLNVTGGTAPYSVLVTDGANTYNYTVPTSGVTYEYSTTAIAANTTYSVMSISDSKSCNISPSIASLTYLVDQEPVAFQVLGGDVCTPSQVNIGLAGSEVGVTYELLLNGAPFIPAKTVVGTGLPMGSIWTETVVGNYTVRAVKGSCQLVAMTGSASVKVGISEQTFAQTGSVCLSGSVVLTNSETGVQYHLYRDGIYTNIAINGNSGSPITFPSQATPGTYTVQAVSTVGTPVCTRVLSGSLTVVNPTDYALQALGGVTSYCQGVASSGITLFINGSQLGYGYQLRNVTTNSYFEDVKGGTGGAISWNNVTAGQYQVVVSTPEGCLESMGNITVTQRPLPTATISIDPLNSSRCENQVVAGGFNVISTFTGTSPFTYTITDDKTPANSWTFTSNTSLDSHPFNPSTTTTYSITNVVDNSGCGNSGVGAATISVNKTPVASITGPNEVCENSTTTLTALPSGASYSWSTTQNSQSIIVSPNTLLKDYSVTVTSPEGCSASATKSITVNPLPNVSFTGLANAYCYNDPSSSLQGTPSSPGIGSFYVIKGGNPAVWLGGTSFNPSVVGDPNNTVQATIYYAYTDEKGCYNESARQQTVVNTLPIVSITNLETSYCRDSPPVVVYGSPFGGTFTVTGGAGLSYTAVPNSGTITINPSMSSPGTSYTINYTYTDGNSCQRTVSAQTTIIDLNSGSLSISGLVSPYCPDDATAYTFRGLVSGLPVSGSQGFLSGNGVTQTPAQVAIGEATFTPLAAGVGTHTVTFRYVDANGCVGVVTTTVQVGTSVTLQNLNSSFCEGQPAVTITATPSQSPVTGEGGYFVVVPPSNPQYTVNSASFLLDPSTWANTDEGQYTITYVLPNSPSNGCDTRQTRVVNITKQSDATFSGLKDNYCINDMPPSLLTQVNPRPGDIVGFSGPGASGNFFRASAAGPGTHTIRCTVTSSNGCVSYTEKSTNVVPLPLLSFANLNDEYCETDAAFTFSVSNATDVGTFKFTSYSSIAGTQPVTHIGNATSATFDPSVGEGVYLVEFTFTPDPINGTGCAQTITKAVTVHRNDPVNYGGLAPTYCTNDLPVTLVGSFASGSFTIDVAGNPGVTNNITAGVPNGTAVFTPSALPEGNYNVTYTYTNIEGCQFSVTKPVVIRKAPQVHNVTGGGSYCKNAATGVSVFLSDSEEAVEYELLINGIALSPQVVITGTVGGGVIEFANLKTVGSYTVIARNANGCSALMNGSATVAMNELFLSLSSANETCHTASNGTASVSVTGGSAPYQYVWKDALGNVLSTANSATGLQAGSYSVDVTDAIGCSDSRTVLISEPLPITMSITTSPLSCPCSGPDCDGAAGVVVSGGVAPYSIVWSNGQTGPTANTLPAGVHSVTVTDANGCTKSETFTITMLSALTLVEDLTVHQDVRCHGAATGRFGVVASGGSSAYEYSLDQINWGTSAMFADRPAGSYTVYVRDQSYPRCVVALAAPVVVAQPAALGLSELMAAHKNVGCFGGSDGQLQVVATGGSGFYEYSVDAGTTWGASPLFATLNAGSRYVWVRDQSTPTCVYTAMPPVVVTQPLAIEFNTAFTNIGCNGAGDGTITVNPLGGNAASVWGYSKDGGATWQSSNVFTGLLPNTYSIRVRDEQSSTLCQSVTKNVVISEPSDISASLLAGSKTDVDCFGESTGKFSVEAVPVGASLEYRITGAETRLWQTSRDFNNLATGTYYVSVRRGTCVKSDVLQVDVNAPAAPLAIGNATVGHVTCAVNSTSGNASDGSISVSVSGGTVPYTYQWIDVLTGTPVPGANGGSTNAISNMPQGNYRVAVTDANGCSVSQSYTIIGKTDWNVVHTSTNLSAAGANDGTISITSITGATPPYTITWSDGVAYNGLSVRNSLPIGDYTFAVTDALGCSTQRTVTIFDDNALRASATATGVQCYGASTGRIDVLIANGVPVYTVTWSGNAYDGTNVTGTLNNAPSLFQIPNLKAGMYSLTVNDNAGAVQAIANITVSQPTAPLSLVVASTDVTCYGNADGTISLSASGGTSFSGNEYSYALVPGQTVQAPSHQFMGLIPGNYLAVVADANGCSQTQPLVITEPALLQVSATATQVTCHGNANGTLTASTTGRGAGYAFRYDWKQLVASNWVVYANDAAPLLNNVPAGTYRVEITCLNDGCTAVSAPVVVSQYDALVMDATVTNVTTCYGDPSGKIYVDVEGGKAPYIMTYSGNVSGTVSGNGPFNIETLPSGTYNLLLTDANGCSINETVTIAQPLQMLVTNMLAQIDCDNETSGTLTFDVTGGIAVSGNNQYYLLLEGASGTNYAKSGTVAAGGTVNASFSGLNPDSYQLTVRDINSSDPVKCQYVQSFQLSNIVITGTVQNATCQGINTGAISNVQITGAFAGYTFAWSTADGLGLNASLLNQTGLSAGTYLLTVTEPARNCTVTKEFVVTNASTLAIDAVVNNVTCHGGNDGAVIVNNVLGAAPLLSYYWNGSAVAGGNTLTNLSQGTVQLRVTDGQGCSVSKSFDVSQPQAISFDLSTDHVCSPYARSVTLSNLTGGAGALSDYTYTYTGPGVAVSKAASLAGMDQAFPANKLLEGLTVGGTYSVTVYDKNLCALTKQITIPGELTVVSQVMDNQCNSGASGSVLLNVSNGSGVYTYLWTNLADASFTASTKDLSGLTAGTYNVVVTDVEQGCSKTLNVQVAQPLPILVDGAVTHIMCAASQTGAISITASGGDGNYSYLWSSGNGSGLVPTSQNQQNLNGGTYLVTVTDGNGCIGSKSFTVEEALPLAFDLNLLSRDCNGVGEIEVTNPSGGSGNYRYTWAGPGITPSMQNQTVLPNLAAGVYTVKLSSMVNGIEMCALTKSITIAAPMDVSAVTKPETCGSQPDGEIDITLLGGVAPYTYVWSTANGGNLAAGLLDQIGLPAGDYHLDVQDAAGCAASVDVKVDRVSQLDIAGVVTPVLCFGQLTGRIAVTVTGGSGSYDYQWIGAGTVQNVAVQQNIAAGNYTLVVTDNVSGCQETRNYHVPGPDYALQLNVTSTTDVRCHGEFTGQIAVLVSGGSPFGTSAAPYYNYSWSGPSGALPNSPTISDLRAGNYQVVVTDANGCSVTSNVVEILEPVAPIQIQLVQLNNVTIQGSNNGSIEVDVTGGSGNYIYVWEQKQTDGSYIDLSTNSSKLGNVIAGIYRVTVTDQVGCSGRNEYVVSEPGMALDIIETHKDVRPCNGSNNGEITVKVIGGIPDMSSGSARYKIEWFSGAVKLGEVNDDVAIIRNLGAGIYTVTVTDANSITVTKTNIEIQEPLVLSLNATVTQHVTCFDGTDGQMQITVSGGKPGNTPVEYLLNISGPGYYRTENVTNGIHFYSGLPHGQYTVSVIDDANADNGFSVADPIEGDCRAVVSSIEIRRPEALVSIAGDQTICKGDNAVLTFVASQWGNIASNPLELTLSNGQTVTMNTSPFVYTYQPASSEIVTITNVLMGTCQKGNGQGAATVVVNTRPTASLVGDAVVCQGELSTLRFYLTGTGPWTVVYRAGNVNMTTIANSSPHSVEVSPALTTQYALVSVTDVLCSQSYDPSAAANGVTVTVNDIPAATLTGNNTICEGQSTNLVFSFNKGQAPWKVTVRINGVEQTIDAVSTPHTLAVSPTETTLFELVSVSDYNGCTQSIIGSATVSVLKNPGNPGPISGKMFVCQGETNVSYSIDAVTDALSYVWELPTGFTQSAGSGTNILVNVAANASNGTIRVYTTNNCGDSQLKSEIFVTVNKLPAKPGPINGNHEFCQGAQGIVFEVDAVADALTYQWTVPAGLNIVSGQGSRVLQVNLDPAQSAISGNVTVQAVNACGNGMESDPFLVNINPLPTVFAGYDTEICGSTYTLAATNPGPGFVGRWSVKSGAATVTDPSRFDSGVTNIAQGETVLEWKVRNVATGCESTDELVLVNRKVNVNAWSDKYITCNGQVVVSGTSIPSGYSGQWSFVSGSGNIASAGSASTSLSNLSADQCVLRWTLTHVNGCQSYAEVEIVNNEPSFAVIQNKLGVANQCGNEIVLQAVNPAEGVGTWSLVSGSGVIVSPFLPQCNVIGLAKGNNVFRWTVVKDGCSKFDEVTVRNNQLDLSAGPDQSTCDNKVANLQGSIVPFGVTATAYWSVAYVDGEFKGSGAFANSSLPNTQVSNLAHGENLLVWAMNQNGCVSTDTVMITSNKPTDALAGASYSICADTAQLTANLPVNGQGYWTVVSGTGQFEDVTNPNTIVRNIQEGPNTFRWNITKNGCFSTSDITVDSKKVKVDAGKDISTCENNATLSAAVPIKGTGEWSVKPGAGAATFIPNNKITNPAVGGLMKGANVLIWTVTYDGCATSDEVVVINNAASEANAGDDKFITDASTTLNATPVQQGEVGTWFIVAGGASFSNINNPYARVDNLQQGPNVFRWTVTHLGCTSTDEVTITNGQTTAANAGLDQEVCEFETTLHANNAGVGVGEWSIVKGFGNFENNRNPRTIVRNLGPGENIFRWTIYYTNSSSADEVTITNNTPTKANAGPDRLICSDIHVLEGSVPSLGAVTWTIISGGGSLVDATVPNTTVSGLAKGANIFKYEVKNKGCSSIDTVKVTNNLPTPAMAGDDVALCTDSVQLMPNNPTYGIGEWRVAQGFAEINNNWARKLASGVNKLVWLVSTSTCQSSDTIVVENNTPTTAFAGYDQPICIDSIMLMANTPEKGVGKWEMITGAGAIENASSPSSWVKGLGLGSNRFRWTIDNKGCKSIDDVEIANNLIAAFAGYDQANCADTAYLVANNPYPGVGTWGILTGSGSGNAQFDNPDSPFTKVRQLDRGDNVLTWTINHKGCKSVSQVVVRNNNPTFANAGPDQSQCLSQVVLAANTPAVGSGHWTIRNGGGVFDNMDKPSASVGSLNFGSNIFRWTIENNGCVSFDDVVIEANTIIANVGPDQPNVCSSSTVLQANSAIPGVGTWSVVGGSSQASFANVNDPNTTVSNLGKGINTLRWTIVNKGCESSAELHVTNNSPSTAYAGNNRELCTNKVTLDAASVAIGIGRWEVLTGSATIANANDPKTSVTGLSKGDNVFRWSVQNGTCIDQDEVLIVNNEPSVPYAGADEVLCYSNYQLKARVPTFGSGMWTILSGSASIQQPTAAETSVTFLGQGKNVFKWTVAQGQCELTDTVAVTNNSPTTANAGPDVQDCKNYSYLDANIPVHGTGKWSLVSGKAVFLNENDGKTRVNELGFGENVLQWTIQNGSCFSSDLVTVFNRIPDQSNAGNDRLICENYVVLNGNDPVTGTGQWSVVRGSGTFEDASLFNTKVNNVGFGENIYQWTIAYGECTTQDVMTVVSNKAYPYAGEDDVTYVPEYTLMASNPGSLNGSWSVIGGSGDVSDPTFFNSKATSLSEGVNTFRWTIDVNGCVAFDEVSIVYKKVPDAGFITDVTSGCFPLTVQFTNYSVGGTQYFWDFGDGKTSTLRNPKHVYTDAGTYVAMLTVPGPDGKDAVYTATISVYPHPTANFTFAPSTVYVPGDPLRCYNMSVGARTYLWNFGDGQTSQFENPEHSYAAQGVYNLSLTVTNQYGCKDSLLMANAVEVLMQGFIVFPNAFKPRPDGTGGSGSPGDVGNEVFRPKYRDVDEFHLQIFDRWGQLLFESHDIQTGWDGLYKNKLSPQDVYVYKSWGRFISGKEFRQTGNVLLVR